MKKNQHVIPHNGNWAIRGSNNKKVTKTFLTQSAAISTARNIAINQHSELIVHGKNGRIRQKNSYGNDPFPPHG